MAVIDQRIAKWFQNYFDGKTVRHRVRGLKGLKSDKGDDALEIVNWHVDAPGYRAIALMSNGKPGEVLNLRPLFPSDSSK